MTEAIVSIKNKKYNFQGDGARDALSKVKYSRVPFKLVRAIGVKWTKKILWPTFKTLHEKHDGYTDASITLPNTLQSLLQKETEGDLCASLDINLVSKDFSASAVGNFTTEGLELQFESEIEEVNTTGNALRDGLNLISAYNVDVDEIRLNVSQSGSNPTATIDIDATVPPDLSKTIDGI